MKEAAVFVQAETLVPSTSALDLAHIFADTDFGQCCGRPLASGRKLVRPSRVPQQSHY